MKLIFKLAVFLLTTTTLFSQEICTSPGENTIDLNIISAKKCDAESTEKNKNVAKTSRRLIARNRIKKVRNKIQQNQSNLQAKSTVTIETTNNFNLKNTLKKQNQKVLFTVVDEIPMFPNCTMGTKNENKKCFVKSMQQHFSKNYYPEVFLDEEVQGRILIQFTIDIYGKPKNVKVVTTKTNNAITNEITRIIKKLPVLSVGKQKGIPVDVVYSFPLNLTLS